MTLLKAEYPHYAFAVALNDNDGNQQGFIEVTIEGHYDLSIDFQLGGCAKSGIKQISLGHERDIEFCVETQAEPPISLLANGQNVPDSWRCGLMKPDLSSVSHCSFVAEAGSLSFHKKKRSSSKISEYPMLHHVLTSRLGDLLVKYHIHKTKHSN